MSYATWPPSSFCLVRQVDSICPRSRWEELYAVREEGAESLLIFLDPNPNYYLELLEALESQLTIECRRELLGETTAVEETRFGKALYRSADGSLSYNDRVGGWPNGGEQNDLSLDSTHHVSGVQRTRQSALQNSCHGPSRALTRSLTWPCAHTRNSGHLSWGAHEQMRWRNDLEGNCLPH
ncbi:hypothetical protein R1flu_004086 [Riccia fluitans]|uniref:Uncharacterized protein n=1 Tax=Riccia fluitans TaxID=41844 RepID=A0ABD1YSA8_9MARC